MTQKVSQFFFLFPTILLSFTSAWDISSYQDVSGKCAEIFFQPSFQGRSVTLKDNEQLSDLTDIENYLNKRRTASGSNDNETAPSVGRDSLSFQVQAGCTLKLSALTSLKGEVHEFEGEEENLEADWLIPKSAGCTCPKICNCEDNILRRSECARAYLEDDCRNCKALFTSLKPGERWNAFPDKWKSDVKSIILRDGCDVSLQVDNESDIKTFSSNSSRMLQDTSGLGNITRYECSCSEEPIKTAQNIVHRLHNESYPPLIRLPKSKGAINTLLIRPELRNHPGLLAALQSLRNKRSSKNAYILLLGLTGSGKSSAVNLLFDHPNITKVGDFVSTTKDILEFTIPITIDELGVENGALHVIDTPGIGDTRGVAEDARFLASLDDFLKKHEDLKRQLPNVVLIFSKFTDNRYKGEGSSFVKMLRTIDLFKDRIIDKKSTNVVFVLSHYMSETKEIQRDPTDRIRSIRQVIQEFSTLPRPIHIVVAENKPEEAQLPSINGFHRLPNGDFYPKNLFDQMQRNLIDNGDPIGEAIVRTAFSNSDDFQIFGKQHRLLPMSNTKVTRYLGILGSFNKAVTNTEVSIELNRAFQALQSETPDLESTYPDVLNTLQRTLFNLNILQISDLPQTSTAILKLFEELQMNPLTLALMQKALNLTVPEFKQDFVVGSGYSLIRDTTLPAKIFEAGKPAVMPSDILYRIPSHYVASLYSQLDNQFYVFTKRNDFVEGRMKVLSLDGDVIPSSTYNSALTNHPGFNLISLNEDDEENPQVTWNSLSAVLDYHTFDIRLTKEAKFSDEFTSFVSQLQGLNLTDDENVGRWKQFFDRYGTHVVTHAYGGGSVRITTEIVENADSSDEDRLDLKTNNEKFTILSETMSNLIQQLANELIGKDAVFFPHKGIRYHFSQRGGNHKHFWSNFSELDEMKNIDEWKDSIKYEPVVLTSRLQLVPISEVIKEIGGNEELSYMIEQAAATLLNASLVYIPLEQMENSWDNPASRDRVLNEGGQLGGAYGSMKEFANMFQMISDANKEMQAQLVQIMAESARKQEKQNEQWEREMLLRRQEEARQEQIRREDEKYQREYELKREMLEMERVAQDNALRLKMEQSRIEAEMKQQALMEEIRSRNEQTMMTFINAENDRRTQIMMSRRGVLDKVFDFVGNIFSSSAQGAAQVAPLIAGTMG